MSDIIIHGPPQSSYVRTARITANSKGITHDLVGIGENHEKLHPYKKFPILQHGDFYVWETAAMCNYIDNNFDGPSLSPKDAKGRATMDQWISAIDCYIYGNAIKGYALKYIFAGEGGPDREAIDKAVPLIKKDFTLLDEAIGSSGYLVGDELTIADFFVAPIIATAKNFPEAKEILGNCRNVMRVFEQLEGREAYQKAQPPPPKG